MTQSSFFVTQDDEAMRLIAVISLLSCCVALRPVSHRATPSFQQGRRRPNTADTALRARRPKTADEWREWRRKEVKTSKPADDELARRAQRWAEAVGADASTLDGLPEARRREFLDEFERDLPKNGPAPRNAPVEDASEINVDWERRVQFDALRDGNALMQNDVLNKAIRSDN